MRAILLGAVAALTMSGAAQAGDWRYVAESQERVFGYDRSSIRVQGNLKTVWTVVVARSTETLAGDAFDYQLVRYRFDCAEEMLTDLTSIWYLLDSGSPSISDYDPRPTRAITPDTAVGRIADQVCQNIPPEGLGFDTSREFARAVRSGSVF